MFSKLFLPHIVHTMINVDADQQTDRSIIVKDVLAVNYCYACANTFL